ncbi:MAG: hypothetical protein U0457_04025 [Candidatus Sericytochromatia bacterium]
MLLEVVKEKHEKIKLEGKLEGIELTAINMIKNNEPNDKIALYTGLTIEKIESLRKNN